MRHRCLREKDCVIHDCPECKSGGAVCHCVDCKKKPYPCGCDNCEYIRRFGSHKEILGNSAVTPDCFLCGQAYPYHEGYHCPEKTEWRLRCGARVVINKSGFEFEILTGDAPGAVNFTEIPELKKILEEIERGNNEK